MSQPTSSIKVDHQEPRSFPNAAIQGLITPFGDLILKAPPPAPEGSPQLTLHKSAYKQCHIREWKLEDIWMYTFSNSDASAMQQQRNVAHQLYYFAGGGFRGTGSKEYWQLCAELCLGLPEYEVNVVSYPLTPNNPAPKSIPHLQ
jgi:hypothetical protein